MQPVICKVWKHPSVLLLRTICERSFILCENCLRSPILILVERKPGRNKFLQFFSFLAQAEGAPFAQAVKAPCAQAVRVSFCASCKSPLCTSCGSYCLRRLWEPLFAHVVRASFCASCEGPFSFCGWEGGFWDYWSRWSHWKTCVRIITFLWQAGKSKIVWTNSESRIIPEYPRYAHVVATFVIV